MLELLNGLPAFLIYTLLFVLLLLCGLGFPMAEELVLLAGGVLVFQGIIHPFPMLVVNVLGVVIGDLCLFGMGRGVSSGVSRSPRFAAWFAHKLVRGRPFFARYGHTTVFLARFVPGLRAPAFLLAGTMQMPLWRFVLIDTLASLIFVPALGVAGYLFADHLEVMTLWFRRVERIVGTLLALVLLAWLCRRYWGKRHNSATATPP